MKFTKFIPLALALTLAVPSFAATATSLSDEMSFGIGNFFNMTRNAGTHTATTTVDEAYSTLTLTAMNAGYHVITNKLSDAVQFSAKCTTSTGTAEALYADSADPTLLRIVFTNDSNLPLTAAVTNITTNTSVDKTQNAEAIAIAVTPTAKKKANTSPTDTDPVAAMDGANAVKYTFNNGEYDFTYNFGTTAVANTFSTHDSVGTYKATLTLTQVTP